MEHQKPTQKTIKRTARAKKTTITKNTKRTFRQGGIHPKITTKRNLYVLEVRHRTKKSTIEDILQKSIDST